MALDWGRAELNKKVGEREDLVFVTQPSMPPLDEFLPFVERIWSSKILTNGGLLEQELEEALSEFLGVDHISLFSNGTAALAAALRTLEIGGEVITTPFSFAATGHVLLWAGLTPVFADISEESFTLDPTCVRQAITPNTKALLPVHCFGLPCHVDHLAEIARQNDLKVIYDAAAAFGVADAGGSILRHGELSIVSFHATKVFTTFEGGAVIAPDAETKRWLDQLKNHGFDREGNNTVAGFNGKMSEIHAAFGLTQLRHFHEMIQRRKKIAQSYQAALADVRGITLPAFPDNVTANYAYYPILVEDDYRTDRNGLVDDLASIGCHPRRYFDPLISELAMYRALPSATPQNLPIATSVARRVLCLPIYPSLADRDIDRIVATIRGA